jgi:hypothetical protein
MAEYRIRFNDSGEYVRIEDERIDLTAAEVTELIFSHSAWAQTHRRLFDPANNPEPYAPWGLAVVQVIDDEDGVIETPVDWREFNPRART